MSFLTTQPEALAYAAGKLQTLGSAMAAESAAVAAPTTGLAPAAADEVSALQAAIFSAYGDLYQSVNTQAATIHQQFVNTLSTSAGSYATTEAANSAATALPFASSGPSAAAATPVVPAGLSSGFANVVNIGAGNWSSAASDLLGMANGGLLPPEAAGLGSGLGGAAGLASAPAASLAGTTGPAGFGATPISAGLAQATTVGRLSVPPSWAAGPGAPTATPSAPTLAGWTGAAPQGPSVTTLPAGIPSVATAGRGGGLGAPRYGVKPTVMGRPAGV